MSLMIARAHAERLDEIQTIHFAEYQRPPEPRGAPLLGQLRLLLIREGIK
jgi:hypothetical protein